MVLCEAVSEVLDPEISLQLSQCSSMVLRCAERSCRVSCGYLASEESTQQPNPKGVGGLLDASYRFPKSGAMECSRSCRSRGDNEKSVQVVQKRGDAQPNSEQAAVATGLVARASALLQQADIGAAQRSRDGKRPGELRARRNLRSIDPCEMRNLRHPRRCEQSAKATMPGPTPHESRRRKLRCLMLVTFSTVREARRGIASQRISGRGWVGV